MIVDSNDPSYYEMRAIEYINEARLLLTPEQVGEYTHKMKTAISLLALARISRETKIPESNS